MAKSAEEIELDSKVNALADARYGAHDVATLKKLFLSYDKNGDNLLSRDEVYALFSDADVGNWLTRGAWVSGTFEKVDKSKDDQLTWEEYLAASSIASSTPPSPTGGGVAKPPTPSGEAPGYGGGANCDPKTGLCTEPSGSSGFSVASVAVGAVAVGLVVATFRAK